MWPISIEGAGFRPLSVSPAPAFKTTERKAYPCPSTPSTFGTRKTSPTRKPCCPTASTRHTASSPNGPTNPCRKARTQARLTNWPDTSPKPPVQMEHQRHLRDIYDNINIGMPNCKILFNTVKMAAIIRNFSAS